MEHPAIARTKKERTGEIHVSEIRDVSSIPLTFPEELSFFVPYLRYHTKEVLEIGGEAFVSTAPGGTVSGAFIYDGTENTGTVYTRSREVFDYFFELRPSGYLFSEMRTERESETYDIYVVDLEGLDIVHRFSHEISVLHADDAVEIERFMASAHPGINRKWVSVALKNGDGCFTVRLDDEIAALGWLSLVNGIGRLHSLFVNPRFRRMGMGEDILYARLLWLKSKRARSAFSEISRYNALSSGIAAKGHMTVCGQVYQYFRKLPPKQLRS